MQPTLFIVSTPIGTLSDFSPRARETLQKVDLIFCEDTRVTMKLTQQDASVAELVRLDMHVEHAEQLDKLLRKLQSCPSQTAALVSDAGTPAVSDPGALLVDYFAKNGVEILTVPGPSALPSAIAASGFFVKNWVFCGFLSRQTKDIEDEVEKWLKLGPCGVVFYESPHRIKQTLSLLAEKFSHLKCSVCASKEISKKFETHYRGSFSEVLSSLETAEIKGEWVVTLNVETQLSSDQKVSQSVLLEEFLEEVIQANGKQEIKIVSEKYSISSKKVYNLLQKKRR